MAGKNATKRPTEDQDAAELRGELEQLAAFARNTGSGSIEQLVKSIARRTGVDLVDDEIEKRRK